MWAFPDDMSTMMAVKGDQLLAGASTAWVPSPTAATLHAVHYLRTSVAAVQAQLAEKLAPPESAPEVIAATTARRGAELSDLLTTPVMSESEAARMRTTEGGADVKAEVDLHCQAILGYVSRWVGQGVGCSKVPDLEGVARMEDRATLRISSQLIANWMLHGLVSEATVMETLRRTATLVDEQNASDASYKPLAPALDGPEWRAALELVFAVSIARPEPSAS